MISIRFFFLSRVKRLTVAHVLPFVMVKPRQAILRALYLRKNKLLSFRAGLWALDYSLYFTFYERCRDR